MTQDSAERQDDASPRDHLERLRAANPDFAHRIERTLAGLGILQDSGEWQHICDDVDHGTIGWAKPSRDKPPESAVLAVATALQTDAGFYPSTSAQSNFVLMHFRSETSTAVPFLSHAVAYDLTRSGHAGNGPATVSIRRSGKQGIAQISDDYRVSSEYSFRVSEHISSTLDQTS